MKNIAIITGLLRDHQEFQQTMDTLVRWRSNGLLDQIVLSTWLGELNGKDDLLSRLNRDGVSLIESRPPPFNTPGNILHQMKAIHMALRHVPDDCHVLKCRTDRSELHYKPGDKPFLRSHYIERLLGGYRPPAPSLGNWPRIFEDRIYLRLGRLTYPFYLRDMIIFAQATDMKKLIGFDLASGALLGSFCNSAESYFFARPILPHFPILSEYLQMANPNPRRFIDQSNGTKLNPDLVRNSILFELDHEFSRLAYATYVQVLLCYFHFGIDFELAAPSTALPIESIFLGAAKPYTSDGATEALVSSAVNNQAIISYLCGTQFLMDDRGTAFASSLEKTSDYGFHRDYSYDPLAPSSLGRNYNRQLQNYFGTRNPIERCTLPEISRHAK